MKLAIYSHTDNPNIQAILKIVEQNSIEYLLNPENIDPSFSYAVSVGGDGTLLDSVHKIIGSNHQNLPLLGINSGRLGFLTSLSADKIHIALENLATKKFHTQKRDMLQINGKLFALNEFTAQRQGVEMIEIEMKIDNTEVARYWADGVIISTATGSTAYSMSVGGAILSPNAPCFIISPVAPHNLSLRPLVVHNTATIDLKINTRFDSLPLITADNCRYQGLQNEKYSITKAKQSIELISFDNNNFYNTLKDKLHWGLDLRT